jgi:NifU-like protein involved in Fe-S cluster formation
MSAVGQDLMKLYSQRILALAAGIPHVGRLEAPDGSAMKRSPLCGSTVTVDVTMDGERIAEFAQDVKACALGQSSASVLGAQAIGRTRDEIAGARAGLEAMLKKGGPAPAAPFDGLGVLEPAKDYKNRHASILLAWDATLAAMEQAAGGRAG